MRDIVLSPPRFGFIVATRAALAVGVGLLIARRFNDSRRRKIGRSLVAAGALATVPAAIFAARGMRAGRSGGPQAA